MLSSFESSNRDLMLGFRSSRRLARSYCFTRLANKRSRCYQRVQKILKICNKCQSKPTHNVQRKVGYTQNHKKRDNEDCANKERRGWDGMGQETAAVTVCVCAPLLEFLIIVQEPVVGRLSVIDSVCDLQDLPFIRATPILWFTTVRTGQQVTNLIITLRTVD